MGRIVKISEEQQRKFLNRVYESVSPKAEWVLNIKEYLDNNFAREILDDVNENGYPTTENAVSMLSQDKQPIKTMSMAELLLLLDDKYNKIIADKADRKKFLKQVIKDWYFGNISQYGNLGTNYIR